MLAAPGGLPSCAMDRGASRELATFRITARARELAFLQGILEASEGLGVIHGTRGGEVWLAAPHSRAADVRELLEDLALERGIEVHEERGVEAPERGVDVPEDQGGARSGAADGGPT